MKRNFNQKKGITLIALVVTIIVLLLLAGVSISMLTGQNGVLKRAADAKTQTDEAEAQENERMQGYEDTIREYTDGLPKTAYTKSYYPSNDFSKKEGDLSKGLVIQDKQGNEYVWIEVPKTLYDNESYNTETTKEDKKPNPGKEYTESDYGDIEYCLKKYTKDYFDLYYSGDTYEPDATIENGWFAGKEEYNTAKQKMLKSVYENGGFWVGRYEAGIEIESDVRTSNKEGTAIVPSLTPVTKQNVYPYNNVTRTQAKVLAERVGGENYTSSLMFGIQWDLVLKYIEEKTVENTKDVDKETTRTNIKNALRGTSKYSNKYIGNYRNAELTLNRGKFAQYGALSNWYKFDGIDKTNLVTGNKKLLQSSYENAIVLTAGASEETKLQNIYDIAGNLYEWTLEFEGINYPCVSRGGSYYNSASVNYAMCHINNTTSNYNSYLGFRVGLWK